MKGTSKEVPQFGKGGTMNVYHLSGSRRATCQCWGPVGPRPILRRKSILGASLFLEKDMFWERPIFGKEDLILERVQ